MLFKIATIAALVGAASAACPNQCSGHGACGNQDVCECYDNWGMGGAVGGDCSDRLCPFELAWVDAPNADGSVHNYAECAAKGVCDRSTGECECLDGYEGKACARQTCKDNCNGHGTCASMDQIPFGTVWGDLGNTIGIGARKSTDAADAWDYERARACVCDAEWTGISCDKKMCPHGTDAMFMSEYTEAEDYDSQVQEIKLTGENDWDTTSSFALTFTSRTNQTFTTSEIIVPNFSADCRTSCDGLTGTALTNCLKTDGSAGSLALLKDSTGCKASPAVTYVPPVLTAGVITTPAVLAVPALPSFDIAIKNALEGLPNGVIDSVRVWVVYDDTSKTITTNVAFDGDNVQGRQNLLELDVHPCLNGCTPKVKGLVHNLVQDSSSISQTVAPDFNSYECGRRGKCDYDTGVCACFEGFTGPECSTITALI